jgi:glyoxylase-like metal-dependent hydrolase (beta-lactamase superfamily II)
MNQPSADETFAVYAIRFAHREVSTRGEHFYRGDTRPEEPLPMDYFVWAAVSRTSTVLVDAGFTPETARRRGHRDYLQSPMRTLAQLGVEAESVEHLVLTHLHYDHVGHARDFPAARMLVQQAEYGFWTGPYAGRGEYRHLYEPDDMTYLSEQRSAGRLHLIDGAHTVTPGVTLHHLGGHTPGMQVVRVKTAAGHVVLASDTSHFYENIEQDRPYSIVDHLPSMYDAFDQVRGLADADALIVAGHDPKVLERYPVAAPGLEGIAVQVAPRIC